MPLVTGEQLAKEVRKLQEQGQISKRLKILINTGEDASLHPEWSMLFEGMLQKPINM
jgi:hypothetical protein